jgi:hypothetical protein
MTHANASPKRDQPFHIRGRRILRWRNGAGRTFEQIRLGRFDAALFAAGHGMTTEEVRAGLGNFWLELSDHTALHTANVRDQNSLAQDRGHLYDQGQHLPDRRAKNHQVGSRDRFGQIQFNPIEGMELAAGLDAFRTADVTDNVSGHAPLSHS